MTITAENLECPLMAVYTAKTAAVELSMSREWIRWAARKYGIGERVGDTTWLFNKNDLRKLAAKRTWSSRQGKPPWMR